MHALVVCALAFLLFGCPPDPKDACARVEARPANAGKASVREDCLRALDAMKSRSSGEYGACAQCVANSYDDAQLKTCRPHCKGMESLLPE